MGTFFICGDNSRGPYATPYRGPKNCAVAATMTNSKTMSTFNWKFHRKKYIEFYSDSHKLN